MVEFGVEGASLPRATLRASHSLGPGLLAVVRLRRTFPKPSIVGSDVCGYAVFKHARTACGDAKACRTELLQFRTPMFHPASAVEMLGNQNCPELFPREMGVQDCDGAGSHACFVSPARAWIEWPIAYRWPGGLGDEGASLPRATLRASHSLGPGLPPVVHLRRTFPKPSIVGLDVCGYAVFKHARAACGDAKACRTELLQFSSFGHPSIWGAH